MLLTSSTQSVESGALLFSVSPEPTLQPLLFPSMAWLFLPAALVRSMRCFWLSQLLLMLFSVSTPSGQAIVSTVDIFNVLSGTWITANLSVARRVFAAASLPLQGLALFAGGQGAFYGLMHACSCVGFK